MCIYIYICIYTYIYIYIYIYIARRPPPAAAGGRDSATAAPVAATAGIRVTTIVMVNGNDYDTGVCLINISFVRAFSRNCNPAPDLVLRKPIFLCVSFSRGMFCHRSR